ncbi:MAG: 5'-nucleotidase C-terminal domain-containing protein [Prevotella sp.]|nr:5'-nucleotidase C-terminal domain-containing protein [Prevotella sp.]
MAQTQDIELRIVETSDVHGSFFPYDFINRTPKKGTLSRVMTYVKELRETYGDRLILLENGDILQGQPTCYYTNYVKPELPNLAAEVVNYMGYDAQVFGNHDVETGHAVYDKWISELKCPVLGANIIDTTTNEPYVRPYTIIEREGVKMAVLGLLTPAIPNWLNEELWKGLRFDELVSTARKWVEHIQRKEHPDIIIGLFHSGREGGITTDSYVEDASLRVAREVEGFDVVFYGHDHTKHNDLVRSPSGKSVVCLDPSCDALMVADVTLNLRIDNPNTPQRNVAFVKARGILVSVEPMDVDADFVRHFQPAIDSVKAYVDREIGIFDCPVYTRDSYFGSSPFTDLIHDLQLELTGADISFNAPLTFDTRIEAGPIHVSDLFNLYKYENQVYVLRMTGEEIRRHLEFSYDQWVTTMQSPDDHIMLMNDGSEDDRQRFAFKNLAFNFDSAAGIDYEVDVTKPDGQKVRILRMSNGEPFDESKWYLVAMNSYRGNGGGELLTKGAGIPHHEIPSRIIFQSDKDERFYLLQYIQKVGRLCPQARNNWHFVPRKWTDAAIERDKALLFGKK